MSATTSVELMPPDMTASIRISTKPVATMVRLLIENGLYLSYCLAGPRRGPGTVGRHESNIPRSARGTVSEPVAVHALPRPGRCPAGVVHVGARRSRLPADR